MISTKKMPSFVRQLRTAKGQTSENLRITMGRVYGPTAYQLRPIAEKLGFALDVSNKNKDGVILYRFVTKTAA